METIFLLLMGTWKLVHCQLLKDFGVAKVLGFNLVLLTLKDSRALLNFKDLFLSTIILCCLVSRSLVFMFTTSVLGLRCPVNHSIISLTVSALMETTAEVLASDR